MTTTTVTTIETTTTAPSTVTFSQPQPGLLVTKELDKAIESCRAKVQRIAKECRAKNRKFRDIEFDIENDKNRCLYGIFTQDRESHTPADVHRVTQIFDKPQFFVGGAADSNDIIQGALGDCWFLSALATVSTARGLVEKFCVERDEKVGVYGFIFFRDNSWVTVIIDDMLYTRVPKWEELKGTEQELYHYDKDIYNKSARKGGKSLYFAKSGTAGETWVPLIEKAYAKLHGNYSHLLGGMECDAIEDLTGGVSTVLQSKDILDTDRFWDEELSRANKDRLFGCSFNDLSSARNGVSGVKVQGLIGNHSYSVLRAVTCGGKRFVVVRNPWGKSEWTGRWSDGSKEWDQEWLDHLPDLGHAFGDDGQFVMEYSDWLGCFSQIDRTILFDETWAMSSQWLHVTCPTLPAAWSYGDLSFKINVPAATSAVIVLAQLDTRYYRDIAGKASWTMDFVLVKEGEKDIIAESGHSEFYPRSVHLEVELEAGAYTVYARLDRTLDKSDVCRTSIDEWQLRKLARIMSEKAKSQSIASNFRHDLQAKHIPTTIESLIEEDYEAFAEKKRLEEEEAAHGSAATGGDDYLDGTVTTTTTTTTTVVVSKRKKSTLVPQIKRDSIKLPLESNGTSSSFEQHKLPPLATTVLPIPDFAALPASPISVTDINVATPVDTSNAPDHASDRGQRASSSTSTSPAIRNTIPSPRHGQSFITQGRINVNYADSPPILPTPADLEKGKFKVPQEDPDSVYMGLRVYTNKDVPATVVGRVKPPPVTTVEVEEKQVGKEKEGASEKAKITKGGVEEKA